MPARRKRDSSKKEEKGYILENKSTAKLFSK
jgi:hypothetical protein